MKWLSLLYMLSVSWLPIDEYGISKGATDLLNCYEDTTKIEMALGFEVAECVTLYGKEVTKQQYQSLGNYDPYYQEYTLGLDAHYSFFEDGLTLHIGVERSCSHGLKCYGHDKSSQDHTYCDVYARVEGKIDLF